MSIMSIKIATLIFTYVLISGCSFAPHYSISPDLDKTELATIFVFRTKVGDRSQTSERLFFYIDDEYIGILRKGSNRTIYVKAGAHSITIKQSTLFVATHETDRIQFTADPNRNYYIRYGKRFSAMSIGKPTTIVNDSPRLHIDHY